MATSYAYKHSESIDLESKLITASANNKNDETHGKKKLTKEEKIAKLKRKEERRLLREAIAERMRIRLERKIRRERRRRRRERRANALLRQQQQQEQEKDIINGGNQSTNNNPIEDGETQIRNLYDDDYDDDDDEYGDDDDDDNIDDGSEEEYENEEDNEDATVLEKVAEVQKPQAPAPVVEVTVPAPAKVIAPPDSKVHPDDSTSSIVDQKPQTESSNISSVIRRLSVNIIGRLLGAAPETNTQKVAPIPATPLAEEEGDSDDEEEKVDSTVVTANHASALAPAPVIVPVTGPALPLQVQVQVAVTKPPARKSVIKIDNKTTAESLQNQFIQAEMGRKFDDDAKRQASAMRLKNRLSQKKDSGECVSGGGMDAGTKAAHDVVHNKLKEYVSQDARRKASVMRVKNKSRNTLQMRLQNRKSKNEGSDPGGGGVSGPGLLARLTEDDDQGDEEEEEEEGQGYDEDEEERRMLQQLAAAFDNLAMDSDEEDDSDEEW